MAQPFRKVYVVGVGMTKFDKPGQRDYPELCEEAVKQALNESGLKYTDVEQACCGYVYGDSTCGQRALYQIGITGIPVYNVNNNCATGSTALFMAKQLIEGGLAQCILAVGFEKMERGSLKAQYEDRANPMERHVGILAEQFGVEAAPMTAQLFGQAAREHMRKYGSTPEHLDKIAWKNHKHSVNNELAQFRREYSLEEIRKARMVFEPMTLLHCCPTSDGAAAAILVSEEFMLKHGLADRAVRILAMEMATDGPQVFGGSAMELIGVDMTRRAAQKAFSKAGLTPNDVQVVELHDCFSANELVSYEALGLCPEGGAAQFIDRGDNTYGGRYVVNPSGGLLSKGHPLGATGLAQCTELVRQVRGQAGKRQVPGTRVGLQHNVGLGGAVVVALYARDSPSSGSPLIALLESVAPRVDGVIAIETGGKRWVIQGGKVMEGAGKAECTLSGDEQTLLAVLSGKEDAQSAFLKGALKVKGNMGLALKIKSKL